MSEIEIIRRYNERMEPIYAMSGGGELRAARGDLVEALVKDVCELVAGVEWRKGTTDLQTIRVDTFEKKHQVDAHVYKDGKLVLVVEAKAYLDSCYYERACHDFTVMRLSHPDVRCIVVALEDSLKEETKKFTDCVFRNVCDKVFFLCDGKRSSSRPLYRPEFRKDLRPEQVKSLLEYLQSV